MNPLKRLLLARMLREPSVAAGGPPMGGRGSSPVSGPLKPVQGVQTAMAGPLMQQNFGGAAASPPQGLPPGPAQAPVPGPAAAAPPPPAALPGMQQQAQMPAGPPPVPPGRVPDFSHEYGGSGVPLPPDDLQDKLGADVDGPSDLPPLDPDSVIGLPGVGWETPEGESGYTTEAAQEIKLRPGAPDYEEQRRADLEDAAMEDSRQQHDQDFEMLMQRQSRADTEADMARNMQERREQGSQRAQIMAMMLRDLQGRYGQSFGNEGDTAPY